MEYYLDNQERIKLLDLPFAKYFALQEYQIAEKGIERAYQFGYSHWYVDFSLPSEALTTWTSERITQLAHLISTYCVYPIFHGNFKAPLASDLEELRVAAVAYTKKEIDIAAKFSAPLILHAGGIVEPRLVKQVKQKALENFLLSLYELVEYACSRGVKLWVENLSNYTKNHPFYYIFTTPSEFDYILSNCCEVDFFMDIGHANVGNGDVNSLLTTFHNRIIGLSLSNNNGVRDQHLSLFHGNLNYKELITTLCNLNWKGYIGIEVRDQTPSETLTDLQKLYHSGSNELLEKCTTA